MLRELAVNTRVIYYLMALLGIIGVLAKAVNQQTLNQMLKEMCIRDRNGKI